ncbi:MAG: DUF1643 domain-containing protein [Verrucomicrobiota bacterium]
MKRDAHISADGRFRYALSRVWDDTLPTVTFIGLNPSTVDENKDDKTVTTCITYLSSADSSFSRCQIHELRLWDAFHDDFTGQVHPLMASI